MNVKRRLFNHSAIVADQRMRDLIDARPVSKNGTRHWYQITNHRKQDLATVYIYDEIGLWGITAADFVRDLEGIDAKSIDVHINSPGGDVFDGIAIYNALANHTSNVTTYIDGLAASAASFIAQAGSTVKIARNASMMIHDAEGICIGNCAAMLEMADLLNAASNNIADIYAGRSDAPVEQWRDRMKAVSWYHSGQDAVDVGLADVVYEPGDGGEPASEPVEAAASAASTTVVRNGPPDQPQSDAPESEAVGQPDATNDGEGEPSDLADDASAIPTVVVDDEMGPWWSPELFRAALATAADQHRLYGFSADAFREIMRAAAENCPYPSEPANDVVEAPEPEASINSAEFLSAIRKGML